jgi:hypothetical protein
VQGHVGQEQRTNVRIIHHADVLAIEGQSYRLRQAEDRSNATPIKGTKAKKP